MINPASSAAQEPVESDDSGGPRATSQRRELALIVAAHLRELRARRNLTQDEVAKAVGCHESAVSRWESGSRLPPCTDILALAKLYGVSCDELLGRREQPVMAGSALIDIALLDRLGKAESAEEFDRICEENPGHTIWLPVEDGASLVPVAAAMRLAREVADRFPDSRCADSLFRPRR